MGLFSSKKKIFVASSVMNLNGSDNQAKFVPTTIVGGAIAGEKQVGQYFINQLLQGNGVKFRQFYRWAVRSGYSNAIGLASSIFYSDAPIDKEALQKALEDNLNYNRSNQEVVLEDAYIDWFDIQWIAEQWTSSNRPDLAGTIKEVNIHNTLIGSHYENRKYTVTDDEGYKYTVKRKVLVNDYRQDISIKYNNGTEVIITKTDYNEEARYLYITYRLVTYKLTEIPSDPKPDIPAVDEDGNPILDKDGNQVMIPQEPDPPTYIKEVIKEEDKFIAYQEGKNIAYLNRFFSSGSALSGTYFPYIPYRHNGNWLSDSYMPNIYIWAKKAYKKLYGKNKYDSLVNQVKKSNGIDQCQFIYEQLGVSINTPWMEGKRYIFEYFYNIYLNEAIATGNKGQITNIVQAIKSLKGKSIFIKSDYGVCNFSNRLRWDSMEYSLKNGKIFPGAKKNKYRIYREKHYQTYVTTQWDNEAGYVEVEYEVTTLHTILEHQISANRYERLNIKNLYNDNIIYGGKSVTYNAYDELANAGDEIFDENTANGESGFLVPLEYSSFREAGLVANTDLAKASQYLVCNSYKVKKVRWYQRGIFKIIGLVVAVVLAVWSGGTSVAGYIGAMTGMSVAAANVAAAVLIAAFTITMSLLIMPLLVKVLSAVFGQIIGSILATVVAMVACQAGAAYMSGTTLTWGSMCNVSNVMKLGEATLNGISKYIQESAQSMLGQITSMTEQLTKQVEELNQKTLEMFGSNSLVSKDALFNNVYYPESPKSFLTRTLMTGADNANMTLDMVYNFPNYTISLQNPISS